MSATRYLGAHVSASGGLQNSIINGDALGVNAIQTMFTAPMRWSTAELKQEAIDDMAKQQVGSGVKKILFHGVYLTNLARDDKQMFHLSKLSVQTHLDAAWRLEQAIAANGGDAEVLGITFHPGSAKDLSPEDGLKRISEGLNWVLDKVEGGMLLLECSAGSGNVLGSKFEELAQMRAGVEEKFQSRVGYVIDTQHTFVSGYDWRGGVDTVIEQIDNILGLDNVKAIHLNDSMTPFASKKDRHANLGEGEIGLEAITDIVNSPRLQHLPITLETPGLKTFEGSQSEVSKLLEIAG